MTKARTTLLTAALLASTALVAGQAQAQGQPAPAPAAAPVDSGMDTGGIGGTIGAGIGYLPRYIGSKNYTAEFQPMIDLNYKQQVFMKYDRGAVSKGDQGIGYNFVRTPNLRVAALANYNLGRNEEDDWDLLRGTGDLEDAVEVGALVEFAFDYFKLDAAYRHDLSDAHNGGVGELGASVGAAFGQDFKFIARAGMTWATQNYNNYYWGISCSQTATGRACPGGTGTNANSRFTHGENKNAGLNDFNLMLTADYALGTNLGLMGRIGYVRLMDQAETSLLSERNDQFHLNATVYYRF